MTRLDVRPVGLAIALVLTLVRIASGAEGVALTPDPSGRNLLLNEDVNDERWAIELEVALAFVNTEPTEALVLGASGNVFYPNGLSPQFLACDLNGNLTVKPHTLSDPDKPLFFTCKATGACTSHPDTCPSSWTSEGVPQPSVPTRFFLPGTTTKFSVRTAASTQGAPLGRGVTVTPNGSKYLVSKDVNRERWSISVNFREQRTDAGGWERVLSSVTGNVYPLDGGAPTFLFCTPRPESTGNIEDQDSMFRLRCWSTGRCLAPLRDCLAFSWSEIPDPPDIPAWFFLPEGVTVKPHGSDAGLSIQNQPFGLPWIASSSYTLEGAVAADVAGVSCATGASCRVTTLGTCTGVPGELVELDGECKCLVRDVDPACVSCASGQCGRRCEYPVGDETARGVCLPDASDGACACFALPPSGGSPVQGCDGELGTTCPGERCCADDPRDGCSAEAGDDRCPGICVEANDCAPGSAACGVCQPDACGNGERDLVEECDGDDLGGQTCASLGLGAGSVSCTGSCQLDTSECSTPSECGNGVVDAGEECDGETIPRSCESEGYCGGSISCSDDCTLDRSSCITGDLPNGAACDASACCGSGVCAAQYSMPDERLCIGQPTLLYECRDAPCFDDGTGQLDCALAAFGTTFCCVVPGEFCDAGEQCCSGICTGSGSCQ